MVVLDFRYEDIKELVKTTQQELLEILPEIGVPAEYDEETKKMYVEITPNRPDLYSMVGIARMVNIFTGKRKPSEYSAEKGDYEVKVETDFRKHTACAVVKGVKLSEERVRDLMILQEKLVNTLGRKGKKFGMGFYPLSKITFPLKYTLRRKEEIRFRPLGWEKEGSAEEILKEHKKGKEFGGILEGRERLPIYVDAEGKIMALLPIVNSEECGKIDENTQEVFVEVSGTDERLCEKALNIAVCHLADLEGKVYEVKIKSAEGEKSYPNLKRKSIEYDEKFAEKILGERVRREKLERMDYKIEEEKVLYPAYRIDILGLIDVVEDLAIAHGYNNFTPTLPNFYSIGKTIDDFEKEHALLRGMGFLEVKTFILTNKERIKEEYIEVKNPKTAECSAVRPSLIYSLKEVFEINKMKGLPQKFYEIGQVNRGEWRACWGIRGLSFSEIRGALQTFAKEKGWRFELKESNHPLFDLCAEITIGGEKRGVVGRLKTEMEGETWMCEIELV